MFSKKEDKLDKWIDKTKKYKIPEMDSFINGIESYKKNHVWQMQFQFIKTKGSSTILIK